MQQAIEAKKLVNYINSLGLEISTRKPPHKHVGAIIADAVMQIGHEYKKQVANRIVRLREEYPAAATVSGFLHLLGTVGAQELLDGWKGQQEHKRLYDHAKFFAGKGIDTFDELAVWLQDEENRDSLIKAGLGIRDKTADYYRVLVRLPDAVKVDSRVEEFLADAGIDVTIYAYKDLRAVVQLAAKQLGKRPIDLDSAIWNYYAKRNQKGEEKMSQEQKAQVINTDEDKDTERLRFEDAYDFAKKKGLGSKINKGTIQLKPGIPTGWGKNALMRWAIKGEIIKCFDRYLGDWRKDYEGKYGRIKEWRFNRYISEAKRYEQTQEGRQWKAWFDQIAPESTEGKDVQVKLLPEQWDQLTKEALYFGIESPAALARLWILERLRQLR